MPIRRILSVLLATAILMVLLIVVLGAAARLLAALGDAAAAGVLDYLALACGIVLAVDLLGLVLLQAAIALAIFKDPPDDSA